MLSPATLRYTERLAAAYRGLDALHRAANPDDRWGIVVLDLDPTPRVETYADWSAARSAFRRLTEEAVDLEEADRRTYYAELNGSALTVIDWNERGDAVPLEAQIAGFLAAPPRPASEPELQGILDLLAHALAAAGYNGELNAAVAAWEADQRIEIGEVVPTMQALMEEAAERTAPFADLPLPPLPSVKLVSKAQFNARCDFSRNTVEINVDPVLTRADLRHLVAHEVFPGHCLQFAARRWAAAEGWGGADGLLSLVKSAGSPLFEGLADSSGDFIGWTDEHDRIMMYVTRLRAGLGTVAAWGLHREGWPLEQARDYLLEHTMVGGPGWVDNRLAYIAPRGRGAHIWSYWLGEQNLRSELAGSQGTIDRSLFRALYGRMHSLASLGQLRAGAAT